MNIFKKIKNWFEEKIDRESPSSKNPPIFEGDELIPVELTPEEAYNFVYFNPFFKKFRRTVEKYREDIKIKLTNCLLEDVIKYQSAYYSSYFLIDKLLKLTKLWELELEAKKNPKPKSRQPEVYDDIPR